MSKSFLHKSMINMFIRCGMQYFFRYIEGIKIAPASAMIIGTSVHVSSEIDLISKRDKGVLLSTEEVVDAAASSINEQWEKGVELDPEQVLYGEKRVRGNAVDMAVKLAGLHHNKLAPDINPKHIERPFTVELNGYPVDISGTLDLQEQDGTLRDLKTRKMDPPDNLADVSIDLSFYGLAAYGLDGEFPKRFALDFLVKSFRPKHVTQYSTRSKESYQTLLMRIEAICKAIESGSFTPCSAEDYMCSEKYCGYFKDTCPYGARGRVQC